MAGVEHIPRIARFQPFPRKIDSDNLVVSDDDVMHSPFQLADLTRPELELQLGAWGYAARHAHRVWHWLYQGHHAFADCVDGDESLPAPLRERLSAIAAPFSLHLQSQVIAHDQMAVKFLFHLADGAPIETVLMRYHGRATACLSVQSGCPLNCVFCATGKMGLNRNLRPGEIVSQAIHADRMLIPSHESQPQQTRQVPGRRRERLRNVVLMGMGEPLLNYDASLTALDILSDPAGLAISPKRLTISTVGVIPAIVRLADERRPYSLAVSLHGATQEQRERLVPSTRTWPLDELLRACRQYTDRLGNRIFFEWTLIDGENDSEDDALRLAQRLRDIPSHVNLIPLNPTPGYDGSTSSTAKARNFQHVLRQQGVPSTVRQRRGIDVQAGCGQLASESS
ncbi:MAG: hypothetical protein RIS70_1430 [Planctomycetota bacterium]